MKREINSRRLSAIRCWDSSVGIFFILLLLTCATPAGAGLYYSGDLTVAEDETGHFRETSIHNLSLKLSQQPTNFLTVNEVVRYSSQTTEILPRRELLAPSIDLLNQNKLLRSYLSMSSSMNVGDDDKLSDNGSYEMSFKSNWQPGLVPQVQVVVSQRKSDGDEVLNNLGLERNSISSTVDWSINAFNMYYNYQWTENETPEIQRINGAESHSGNLEFRKDYWGKKLQVSFRQGYTDTEILQKFPIGLGGLVPQGVLGVMTGTDNTPADSFEDPAVVVNPGMRDGDLAVTAYGVASPSNFNNIVLTMSSQIDQIHLYTQTNLGANPSGLTWTLYTNDILGTNWDAGPSVTGVTYNSAMQRFEIPIAVPSVNYIKLVLDVSLTASEPDFTEVQVFDSRLANIGENVSQQTTSDTLLNLAGRLSPNWSYLARIDRASSKIASASPYKDERLSHGGDLKYNSSDGTFSSAVGFFNSNTKTERLGKPSESRLARYSLDMGKIFFPTFSAGIGFDVSEVFKDSVQISESTVCRFDSHAQLYPDLDMSLTVRAQENESFLNLSKNSLLSGEVSLSSRLIPSFYITWRGGFSESESEPASLVVQSLNSSINFNWRLSDDLQIDGGAATTQSDSSYDPVTFFVGMDLVISEGLLLESDYRRTKEEKVIQRGKLSLTWFPKNGFRLEGGCNYRQFPDQPGKEFLLFSTLTVNFALP